MASFNNRGGSCFAKGSLVLMKDNTYKKVEDIQKGDQIISSSVVKTIECVVES